MCYLFKATPFSAMRTRRPKKKRFYTSFKAFSDTSCRPSSNTTSQKNFGKHFASLVNRSMYASSKTPLNSIHKSSIKWTNSSWPEKSPRPFQLFLRAFFLTRKSVRNVLIDMKGKSRYTFSRTDLVIALIFFYPLGNNPSWRLI